MEGELAAFSGRWLAIMVTMCLQPPRGDWVSQLSRQLVTNLRFVSPASLSDEKTWEWWSHDQEAGLHFGGKMNSSRIKKEWSIVKLVIVWSWWVVMRTVLHQWIYKRCNFEIWKYLGKKHGGTANCFIIRRPRIVWISMFCWCWWWIQEKMGIQWIPWPVKAAWAFVHRWWAFLQIWDGTFIRILSPKDKQANSIEEMLAPLKMWEVVGLLVSGWCWLVSVGLYNSLYSSLYSGTVAQWHDNTVVDVGRHDVQASLPGRRLLHHPN